MTVRLALLKWWVQPRVAGAVAFSLFAAGYTLVRRKPFAGRADLIVLLWALAAAYLFGRPGRLVGAQAGFLYTTGYSRDALWAHRLLAAVVLLAIAWAGPAFVVWSGLRSAFQDRIVASPYYPLMYVVDAWAVLRWLSWSVVLVPLFHYAGIRALQPTRGASSGMVISALAVAAWLIAIPAGPRHDAWYWGAMALCGLAVAAVTLIASLRLHRRMEVRQWASI